MKAEKILTHQENLWSVKEMTLQSYITLQYHVFGLMDVLIP